MKHPFVFSFPRSGLHLTSKIINWDLFYDFKLMDTTNGIIEKIKQKNTEVLFTHKTTKNLDINCINFILKETKPIFLIRDPKDVLTSWYHLLVKNVRKKYEPPSIKEYLIGCDSAKENRITMWRDHIRGFRKYENKLHVVRYENLLNNFKKESEKLSDYLKIKTLPILPKLEEVKMSRKGIIGDYKNFISADLVDKIHEICKQEINYINGFLY